MSKDLKPKQRIGQTGSKRGKVIAWTILAALISGGGYTLWRYNNREAEVEVPVARVRRAEFIIAVKTRGELKSVNSVILTAPQVPSPRIVRLAESGKPVKQGDVVVEFDAAQLEQELRSLVESSADTVEHGRDMLAHRRPVRAAAREFDLLRRREQSVARPAQPLHHGLRKRSL